MLIPARPRTLARLLALALTVAAVPLLAHPATAVTCDTYTGADNGDWSTAASWSTGLPGSGTCADLGGKNVVVSSGSAAALSVTNGSLQVTGGQIILGDGTTQASDLTGLTVSGGTFNGYLQETLTVTGVIEMTGTSSVDAGGMAIHQTGLHQWFFDGSGATSVNVWDWTTDGEVDISNTALAAAGGGSITTPILVIGPGTYAGAGTLPIKAGYVETTGTTDIKLVHLELTTTGSQPAGTNPTVTFGSLQLDPGSSLDVPSGATVATKSGVHITVTGGTISGNGTLAAQVDNSGGTMSPGTSGTVGTLHIAGNYNQSGTGTMRFDLASALTYDLFEPSGNALIDGGTIQMAPQGGYTPTIGTAFDVIQNSAGVSVSSAPTITPAGQYSQHTISMGYEVVAASADTTSTAVTVTPSTATSGQAVTITATVTDTSDASYTPTGSVQLYDAGNPIGSPLTLSGGSAQLVTSSLALGNHFLSANYTGSVAGGSTNAGFKSSTSATKPLTVQSGVTAPGAPGVSAKPGDGQATITINAPASNGGASIDHYTLTMTGSGAPSPQTVHVGANAIAGLTNGVAYGVSVTAHNSAGDGPAGTASVTPAAVPGAPTISGVQAGNGSITATFAPPASTGGSPVTSYTVTAAPLDAASGPTRTATGAGSPISVTGLTNGAAYNLTVRATNTIGDGPESASLEGIAGLDRGVSLLLSKNPVPVGHALDFYGYVANHSVPLARTRVVLQQRLSKTRTNTLATVTTDAQGRFRYSLRLVHTGAVRAHAQIESTSVYSKELLAKVAFVLLKVKATITHGHIVITGAITPGSPSPFGEAPDRVAIYKATADGKKGAYIGDAKLASTAKGAPSTSFTYDHKASVLGTAGYVYVNPLGTRANTSTHVTVRVH